MALTNQKCFFGAPACTLFLILAMTLGGCGTFHVSVQIQTATSTPAGAELSNYVFADVIVLRGYSLPDLDVLTGVDVPLHLYWTVKAAPRTAYALNLQLRDADGMLLWSSTPAVTWMPGLLVTQQVLYFPSEIASGEYSLDVVLFDPVDGTRAPVNGPNHDGAVRLANLRLLPGGTPSSPRPGMIVTPIVTKIITATVRP